MIGYVTKILMYTDPLPMLAQKSCKKSKLISRIVWLCLAATMSGSLQAAGLSLLQTEQLAIAYDPVLKAQADQALAVEQETVAADVWDDPRLRIGVIDVPTDSFDLAVQPMTELELGYQQMLPRGNTQDVQVRKKRAQYSQISAAIKLREREIKMKARNAWLDLYAQQQTEIILLASRQLFNQQLDVSQSLYAAGRSNQQDVLQADLEVSLVDDKLQKNRSQKHEALARLVQLVGDVDAQLMLDDAAELFQSIEDNKVLREQLRKHPLVQIQDSVVSDVNENVAMAQQQYKPQWGFDVSYNRSDGTSIGSEASSNMSFMLMFDLPLFTSRLQDPLLAASRQKLQAERYMSQDVMLKLTVDLEQTLARWQQLTERLALYDQRVVDQAQQNARVALKGYQSGVVSFEAMIRARNGELEAQMQRLNLYVEKAMIYAQVLYLTAE